MRKLTLALLMTAFSMATPIAVVHAQSVQQQADVAVAKFKGAWTQSRGAAKEEWGKLTDRDIDEVDGRREVLVGKLQVRYAISHDEAERRVGQFETKHP